MRRWSRASSGWWHRSMSRWVCTSGGWCAGVDEQRLVLVFWRAWAAAGVLVGMSIGLGVREQRLASNAW